MLALKETCKDCHCYVRELVHKNLKLFKEVEKFNALHDITNRAWDRATDYDDFYDDYDDTSVSDFISKNNNMWEENKDPTEFLSTFRKGFLHVNMQENGRKKLRDKIKLCLFALLGASALTS